MKSEHVSALSRGGAYSLPALFLLFVLQLSILYTGLLTHPLLIIGIPIVLLSIWWLICNPGLSLLLMALTGIIKGYLHEQVSIFATVDYTLLAATLVWIGILRLVLEGKWRIPPWAKRVILAHALICFMLAFSIFYTPSPVYGLLKAAKFLFFTSTMFIVPLVIVRHPQDSIFLLKYFKVIVAILAAVMFGQIVHLFASGALLPFFMRLSILGSNPIEVARFLAMGASIIMVILIRHPGRNPLLLISGLLVVLVGLVSTGSRGPILALFLGMLVYGLVFESKYRTRLIIASLIMMGIVALVLVALPESLAGRLLAFDTQQLVVVGSGFKRVSTVATRLSFWSMSIREWLSSLSNSLFGIGSGAFSSLFIWRDFRWYPHNIFIEVLVELGLVGLVAFVYFWFICWRIAFKGSSGRRLTDHSAIWVAVTLVRFFAAQFSGDVSDNRLLWMLMAITMASVSGDWHETRLRNA